MSSSAAGGQANGSSSSAQSKLESLQAALAALQAQRAELSKEALQTSETIKHDDDEARVEQALARAKELTQQHILLLTQYNKMKDVASQLVGMIAEKQDRRVADVMRDYGLDEND